MSKMQIHVHRGCSILLIEYDFFFHQVKWKKYWTRGKCSLSAYMRLASRFFFVTKAVSGSNTHLSHLMTKPKMICATSEDSDQPGHPPSLIRVFTVSTIGIWGPNVSSFGQRILWSDWTVARLIPVFTGRKGHLLVLSWGGSFAYRNF